MWKRGEIALDIALDIIPVLRKHAYSNILKILPPTNVNFQIKILDIFHISAQNINCWYTLDPPQQGGSNEYPQSVFLSGNEKNSVYICKPRFYYIKMRFKGVRGGGGGSKLYRYVFVMERFEDVGSYLSAHLILNSWLY